MSLHKRQRSASIGDADARKRAFPSDVLLAEEQAPELATLDAEDIRLAPLAPHLPDPFPADEPDSQYPPLPSPELVDEIDDLDLTLPAPTSSQHTPLPSDQTPSAALPSTQTEPPPPSMSSPPTPAPVQPPRQRARGVDPTSLKTVANRWAEDGFEEAAPEDVAYPYLEGLNERVIVWRGDITTLSVDAIVNAANRALLGGGGVDGAIHSAAGEGLYDQCKLLGGAETGESKITGGHDLPALHVIHTVGPIYSRGSKAKCEELLRSCYQTTLELAVANNCKTLAFSGISTGIYGYPLDAATRVALDVTRSFLVSPAGASLEKVIFTVFRQIDVDSYAEIVPEFFPPPPPVATSEVEPTPSALSEAPAEETIPEGEPMVTEELPATPQEVAPVAPTEPSEPVAPAPATPTDSVREVQEATVELHLDDNVPEEAAAPAEGHEDEEKRGRTCIIS